MIPPFDIVLQIIELVKEDEEILKALALASPVFVELCQERLFESIEIQANFKAEHDSAPPPASFIKFHAVVTKNPRIPSYIQEIKLAQHSTRGQHTMAEVVDQLALITQVFDALSSSPIHTLSFLSHGKVRWTDLDLRIRSSLLKILQKPCFQHISLHELHFPRYLFSHFTHLQSVKLYSPRFPWEQDSPLTRMHQISQLTYYVHPDAGIPWSLDTHTFDCVGPSIGLDLSSLQYLDLNVDLLQIPRLSHLFQLPKLTHLEVSTDPSSTLGFSLSLGSAPSLRLSGLANLTHLTLTNLVFDSSIDQFKWIRKALASLTTAQLQIIHSVTIVLRATSDAIGKIAEFEDVLLLARCLSHLHRSSVGVKSILVHMKISESNEDTILLAQGKISPLLAWEGCESVFQFKIESN
ncbi:hypothetical protein BDN72DRAFT_961024 [Pluteus cervinus]|uniref:Uncharacterized protein n=1 Tax=Pluteus cervinus TaxID=181527 RepID=A0ACD3AQ33_9AGAR|nr:hypothetical protein BDN72DRAFT_961024 [Pluteus cervinus]